MNRLLNKVAIVTGGGTGIGEAICKKFAREGARLIVSGFPEDPIDDVVNDILEAGGTATAFSADISIEENARACVEKAVRIYGRLDILINNAGVFPLMEEVQNFPIDGFDYMIRHNIRTTFLMTRYALPELRKTRGCIVAAGSESGSIGMANNAVYGGTKGWVHAFIRGVAVEQARYGVRANCVCPGAIDTAWTRKENGPMTAKDEQLMIDATPMGRRGTPEEISNAYLFLASDEASYVTGSLFAVDGGITIAKGSVGEEADEVMAREPEGELRLHHSHDGATNMLRGSRRETHQP